MRLPAFGFLVLALGEWLPLVVMYITPVIPEACRIPQQVQRSLRKLEDTRQRRLLSVVQNSMSLMSRDRGQVGGTGKDKVHGMNLKDVRATRADWKKMTLYELALVAAQQDCWPGLFERVPFNPPKFWLQRNVRKKFEYLRTDDRLIERDGGWAALSKEEVQRACVDRGLNIFGKREDEMRKSLALLWVGGGKA
jgi:hypothetical protein